MSDVAVEGVPRPRDKSHRLLRIATRKGTPLLPVLLWSVVVSVIAIDRHDHFATHGFDLGIFDQTIWGYSHFEVIPNTVKRIPNLLGDHFHPILVLLAPAYWFWDNVRVLLVVQVLLLGGASLPVFYWARRQLDALSAYAIQGAFLVFFGLVAGAVDDFHEVAVAVPVLALALYATVTRRNHLFLVALVAGLLTKEDLALTFLFLGLYVLFVQRRWRLGLFTVGTCLAWFAVVLKVLIPAAGGRTYAYWSYRRLGGDWSSAAEHLHRAPWLGLQLLGDRTEKIKTLVYTGGSWLFLPLVSPLLLVAIAALAERFWSSNHSYWSTRFQYSLVIAPILAFAAIDSIRRVADAFLPRRRLGLTRSLALASLVAAASFAIFAVKPTAMPAGYLTDAQAASAQACLATIPRDASVAASDPLVPHLTHRRDIYPLFARDGQEYLAVEQTTAAGRRATARISSGLEPWTYHLACESETVALFRR